VTHLYAGADTSPGPLGRITVAKTACGLRKAFVFDRRPSDVVDSLGAVTCPGCRQKAPGQAAGAQEGNKAQ